MLINRRGILGGMASMLAAPAIVHAGNLMPVKVMDDVFKTIDSPWYWTATRVRLFVENGLDPWADLPRYVRIAGQ